MWLNLTCCYVATCHLKCLLRHDVYDQAASYCVNWHRSRCRVYCSAVFCHHVVSAYSHVLWGLWVLLYSVLFVRHAKDLGARWRSVGWMNRPGWTAVCVLLCDSGRIPWYKAVSLRSLCSHTRDALYFSPRVGWQGWGRGGGGSMVAARFLYCHSCFTTVSLGKSYGKHNGKAITWKQ